jgi:hypothetical protein
VARRAHHIAGRSHGGAALSGPCCQLALSNSSQPTVPRSPARRRFDPFSPSRSRSTNHPCMSLTERTSFLLNSRYWMCWRVLRGDGEPAVRHRSVTLLHARGTTVALKDRSLCCSARRDRMPSRASVDILVQTPLENNGRSVES